MTCEQALSGIRRQRRKGAEISPCSLPFPPLPPPPGRTCRVHTYLSPHESVLWFWEVKRSQVSVRCHGINREFDTVNLANWYWIEKEKRNYSQVQFDSIILWWPVWRVRQRNQSYCAAKSKALQYHDRNVTSCISHASRQLHHITSHPGHWKAKV